MAVKLDVAKSHKAEEAEVSSCVSNLIQAFANGLNVFKRLRERRRKRKARKENQPPDTANTDELQLSTSLRRGPQELAEKYDACYSQTGHSFAKGDAIAHASLAETLIKLNTGLVAIIASFLNHDQKGGKTPLNLDYKSLTSLSDASRREALHSMTQLYQRLSQSQLQLQYISTPSSCVKCGSRKHADCSARSSSTSSSSKDKKKHSTTRQRVTGPTITRMPLRSSNHPQLVVVRPKPSRKGSSSSNSSSSSKSHSPSTSTHTSPLASPLPLYIAEEPFEIETNGIIRGILGAPMPPLAGTGRRRKDSFNDAHRPSTWPEYEYPYITQEHLHMPSYKLPSFVPATPRKSSATPVPRTKPTPPPKPAQLSQKYPSRASTPPAPSPKQQSPLPPAAVARRRMDKVTPSSYTFASDSTKLGEIPQRNWTTPWDYEEAERLNNEAAGPVPVVVEGRDKDGKKKGLLRRWRRGSVNA
ncbi:hypothetical protein CC86DRAFT_214515 [Ophiobolus disseminans]|uniref:Uncharacterized protein n=1 Tax=Ophiobolus disseminans TaxID=1469910 RepID=A0A6A7A3G4_9PLEO|nr:hypothetical protein CC86DRAFT_214515 [Ophiobolus disseminans]